MRAAVIDGPLSAAVVDVPEPTITDGDVLVRVAFVGLCGTDLELLHGTSPYIRDGRATLPHRFGHEWVGTVIGIGADVTDIDVGATVTGSTMVFCSECAQCSVGRRNLCTSLREVGLYDHPGGAADLLVMPSRAVASFGSVAPTPAHVLVEPLVTVLEAVDSAQIDSATRILVLGAGTIGSLAAIVLTHIGARVDIVEPCVITHLDTTDVVRKYDALSATDGPYDVVVEASGAMGALSASIGALRPGGTCLLVGVSPTPEAIDPGVVALSGISIIGVRHGVDHYHRAVHLFPELAPALNALIDSVIPLADIGRAFARLDGHRERPKVVLSLEN